MNRCLSDSHVNVFDKLLIVAIRVPSPDRNISFSRLAVIFRFRSSFINRLRMWDCVCKCDLDFNCCRHTAITSGRFVVWKTITICFMWRVEVYLIFDQFHSFKNAAPLHFKLILLISLQEIVTGRKFCLEMTYFGIFHLNWDILKTQQAQLLPFWQNI